MSEKVSNKKMIKIIPLIISMSIPFIIMFLVNILFPNIVFIYEELQKNIFFLPKTAFLGITILFSLIMGIYTYKIYILKYNKIDNSSALFVYGIHLLLFFLWSIIFFGLRLYGISFVEFIFVILFGILMIKRFYNKINKKALIMILYFIWLIYIEILIFFVWMLNEM